jgi:Holliday junction resolvasome RuvABC endonuclease subunit
MSKILGLDVSTSVTGVALVEKVDDAITTLALEHIEFKDCKTLWEKVDKVKVFFESFLKEHSPDSFFVEESLMGFRTGMSSAATITTLAKFNGLVSYTVRNLLGKDPSYIAATSARKRCGIKILKTSECGKNGKQQTFEWAMAGPLKDHKWPTKKNGEPKDWAKDVTDAYVIARAGALQQNT